ncbi:hypothetical protein AAVH_33963, partial [Aphelenchoides avenae]
GTLNPRRTNDPTTTMTRWRWFLSLMLVGFAATAIRAAENESEPEVFEPPASLSPSKEIGSVAKNAEIVPTEEPTPLTAPPTNASTPTEQPKAETQSENSDWSKTSLPESTSERPTSEADTADGDPFQTTPEAPSVTVTETAPTQSTQETGEPFNVEAAAGTINPDGDDAGQQKEHVAPQSQPEEHKPEHVEAQAEVATSEQITAATESQPAPAAETVPPVLATEAPVAPEEHAQTDAQPAQPEQHQSKQSEQHQPEQPEQHQPEQHQPEQPEQHQPEQSEQLPEGEQLHSSIVEPVVDPAADAALDAADAAAAQQPSDAAPVAGGSAQPESHNAPQPEPIAPQPEQPTQPQEPLAPSEPVASLPDQHAAPQPEQPMAPVAHIEPAEAQSTVAAQTAPTMAPSMESTTDEESLLAGDKEVFNQDAVNEQGADRTETEHGGQKPAENAGPSRPVVQTEPTSGSFELISKNPEEHEADATIPELPRTPPPSASEQPPAEQPTAPQAQPIPDAAQHETTHLLIHEHSH